MLEDKVKQLTTALLEAERQGIPFPNIEGKSHDQQVELILALLVEHGLVEPGDEDIRFALSTSI